MIRHEFLVIGAGPAGICSGVKLKESGRDDFVILEKASGVGGTWYHNRYPGAACDVPSHLYSYAFEIKKDWSRPYAPQPEILEYLEFCADKYDVRRFCRFDCGVAGARWSDDDERWTVELESGEELEAEFVVSAIGMFNDLTYPDLEGRDAPRKDEIGVIQSKSPCSSSSSK